MRTLDEIIADLEAWRDAPERDDHERAGADRAVRFLRALRPGGSRSDFPRP